MCKRSEDVMAKAAPAVHLERRVWVLEVSLYLVGARACALNDTRVATRALYSQRLLSEVRQSLKDSRVAAHEFFEAFDADALVGLVRLAVALERRADCHKVRHRAGVCASAHRRRLRLVVARLLAVDLQNRLQERRVGRDIERRGVAYITEVEARALQRRL